MQLVEFLKRYTKVDSEFIDDFFSLYKPGESYKFVIDIDAVVKWFNIKKGHIKDLLKASYIENEDYIITRIKDKKVGKPKETILLTPKCFKLMAMRGKNKKADKVREFYYELEVAMDQYKEYIIQGLNEKIAKLEYNQKPKVNPSKGVIYVLKTANGVGYYKVGKTKNLKQRMQAYSSDKKDDVEPVFLHESDNIDELEKCIKKYAKKNKYRKYKEVYQLDVAKLKEYIATCDEELNKKLDNIDVIIKQDGGTNNYYLAVFKHQED